VLSHGADAAVLARATVAECFNRNPITVRDDANIDALLGVLQAGGQSEFPVVSEDGRLTGMIDRETVRQAAEGGEHLGHVLVAADLVRPNADRVTPEDSLLTALRRLGSEDVDYLPVVDVLSKEQLLGVVSRQDVMAAYERGLSIEGH
jgi:CIC family chloride channel protein